MWRRNPTRFVEYIGTCAMGEDLFEIRKVVREKAKAIIKERQLAVPAALRFGLSEALLEPPSSSAIQDK
jgi:hypothetical protein